MTAKLKQCAGPGDDRAVYRLNCLLDRIGGSVRETVEDGIDLCGFETGNREVEADLREGELELAELERQYLHVPSASGRQLIIG